MQTIALYLRTSSDLQRQANSIEAQRHAIHGYLASKGIDLAQCVEYPDDGESGATMNRPQWKALNAAIDKGEHSQVIFYAIDRAARTPLGLLEWIERTRNKIKVTFIVEGLDTTTPMGECVLTILAAIGKLNRQRTARDTSNRIRAKLLKGEPWGGAKVIDPSRPGCRRFTDEEEATIAARARETSVKGAAREFKCHPLTVQKMLKRAG